MHVFQCVRGFARGGTQLRGGGGIPGFPPSVSNPCVVYSGTSEKGTLWDQYKFE